MADTDGRPDLPSSWTAAAAMAFDAITDERGDTISSAELTALLQACSLISSADRLDEVTAAAGMVATGSTGQEVVHPGVLESRLARTAAAAILTRLARNAASNLAAWSAASERASRAALVKRIPR